MVAGIKTRGGRGRGSGNCDIICNGPCVVDCPGSGACDVACPIDLGAAQECGDLLACGPCP